VFKFYGLKKVMRLLFALFIVTAIQLSELRADHFMGGQITYETIDLDTLRGIFQVTLRLERPCNSYSKLNPEYAIKVLEYSTKPSPIYNLSVYSAKLFDSSYIYYPCTAPSATCANSGGQVIEVRYYKTQIVVQNTNKECVVYFDEYSNRSYSDNLMAEDDPMLLYTTFIPKYQNSQVQMVETKRHFPLKDKLSEISYIIADSEGDSLSFKTSLPFKTLNYSIIGQNLNYSLMKSQAKAGLHDNRPFFMQEPNLTNSSNAIQFTPTVGQSSWLTIVKFEYRKINLGTKDTWMCISKSNMDRLFAMFQINSQFQLGEISSPSSAVKINGNQITICNNGIVNPIKFQFPIEKGIEASRYKINLGLTDISSQFTVNRKTSTGSVDTLILNYNSIQTGVIDFTANLRFDFELCHSASGVGFDRSFQAGLHVFNYRVFDKDTLLSCSSSLAITTLLQKAMTVSWGNYSPINKTISIANPKDTWVVTQLVSPNPLCPSKDSIYINQGSVFSIVTTGFSPSCKGYADASAKVSVTGTNGPFTYRWSNSSTLDSIASISAGKYVVEVNDKDKCMQTDTLTILEQQGIEAHWVMDSVITCYGGSNGRGHIQVTSSLKPSQYNWITVIAVDSFLANLSAKIYEGSYRYTNNLNKICDQAFSFTIPQSDSIYLHIVTTDNTCFGESKGKIAILPVGGHGDFLFYFDQIETSVGYKDRLANGIVQVYAKDGKNCITSTYPVTIKSPDRLRYNIIANNPSCAGVSNGLITLNHPTGGTSPYSFSFNHGDYSFNTDFPNLDAGVYTVKMRDYNNCSFIQNFSLTPSYTLNAKPNLIEDSKCPLSSSGKIHLDISNGISPYKIYYQSDSLSLNNTMVQLNDLRKGNYAIRIVDNNGCNWLTQYRINEPDTIKLNSTLKHESCFGLQDGQITTQAVSGGNLPYGNMKWYNETNSLIPYPQFLKPGKYYLRFEDNKNCSYEFPFQIYGKPELKANLEILQPINCHGYANGKIKSSASGGSPPFTYSWKNHSQISSNELSNLLAGKYFLEIKDMDNCKNTDSILLDQPNPITLESIKIKNTDCPNSLNGAMTILSLSGNGSNASLSYKLKDKTNFSPSKTFTNLTKDSYTIVVQDSAGCQKEFNAEVKVDKAIDVQLAPTQTIEIGQEFQLSPNLVFGENTQLSDITSYDWNPKSSLSCTDCLAPKFTASQTETYTVEIHYGKTCKALASTNLIVSKPDDLYIPNSFSPNGDDKNDIWYVHGKNIIGFDAKIYNRVGELVYTSNDIHKGWDGTYKGIKETSNTYKYLIKVTYTDKSQRSYEGSLNLFR
jgi:gliding motility-associated-like protein